jgi:hypothetical protein
MRRVVPLSAAEQRILRVGGWRFAGMQAGKSGCMRFGLPLEALVSQKHHEAAIRHAHGAA